MPLDPELTEFSTTSPVLVNYNYVDVLNGTGYINYYLIESETAAGRDHHLTPYRDYSNKVEIVEDGAATLDFDYDLTPFTIAQTINGTVLVSLAAYSNATTSLFTVELYRVVAGAETKIGSTVTLVIDPAGLRMIYMPIPLSNELFQVGDVLRLRVAMTNQGGATTSYGIDPANRTHTTLTITTTSKVIIPYNLDL